MDKKSIYKNSIILIGPIGVGKSLIAKELSKRTGLPIIPLDKLRKYYYPKFGYDINKANKAEKEFGIEGWYEYQKPFEKMLAVEILNNNVTQPSIIDFGAGFSVYEDKTMFSELQKAMRPYKNVFNLELPTNYKSYNKKATDELNVHFKQNNCNYSLSTFDITVDVVDFNGEEYIFNDNKFNRIISNIISVSGVKEIKRNDFNEQ